MHLTVIISPFKIITYIFITCNRIYSTWNRGISNWPGLGRGGGVFDSSKDDLKKPNGSEPFCLILICYAKKFN